MNGLDFQRKIYRGFTLRCLRAALMPELSGKSTTVLFKDAKTRHAILTEHETPASVLAAFGDEGEDRWAESEALTRTLLTEQQTQSTRTFTRLRPLFADLHGPDLREPEPRLSGSET